jgi:hypothetical protein
VGIVLQGSNMKSWQAPWLQPVRPPLAPCLFGPYICATLILTWCTRVGSMHAMVTCLHVPRPPPLARTCTAHVHPSGTTTPARVMCLTPARATGHLQWWVGGCGWVGGRRKGQCHFWQHHMGVGGGGALLQPPCQHPAANTSQYTIYTSLPAHLFLQGPVFFLVIDTESPTDPGSPQGQ